MNDYLPISVDAGAGAIKIYGLHGGLQVLAQVSANRQHSVGRLVGLASQKPPLHIQDKATSFYVDAGAHDWGRPVENLSHDRFSGTPEMRALFKAALTRYIQQCGPLDVPLQIMLGLPLEPLSGGDAPVTVESARRWLKGQHTWQADDREYHVEVADVKVTSQPVGAMFDYLLDDTGEWIPARKAAFRQEIGVISIGFDTVELMVVQNKAVVPAFTVGDKLGARELLRLVDPRGLYAMSELEPQLRAGTLDVREHLPVWERKITGFIDAKWRTPWRRFAVIVIVGGEAVLLRDTLPYKFNGKAYVPNRPVLAVVRGLYKLLLNQGRG